MNVPPKKILFLITKSTLGGAQQYVFDLALSLPQEQFSSVIIAGGTGPLVDLLTHEGFVVYQLPTLKRDISLLDEIKTFFALLRIIRKEQPDILHINSSKAGVLGSLAGRLLRVPKIVFTAHGWAFNEDGSTFKKRIFRLLHILTVLCAHTTITVSDGLKKQLNWPPIQKKMVTVHLGRTITDFKTRENARGILEMKVQNTSARLIDYNSDFWLGTIAELHPIKRLNRAIDSLSVLIKQIPTLRFIIIHDGQERKALTQQVKDLGLEEHVFFTGTIENAARLLPAFDLFVLPSKSEAFGYVLIEAGQAGVPVVATNVGGIPDVIEHGKTGILVEPDNTPALTEALRTMITDNKQRAIYAQAHHEKSMIFTLEKMVEETLAVYKMV